MGRLMDIKLRRDTAANWTSVNPVLDAGEPGFETDTKRVKIGDGSSAWTSLGYAQPGGTELVYKYTVSGSDKASIDTGSDTAQAGSNDWTNGDLLEVYIQARTDEATVGSFIAMTFNNDTGSNYRGVAVFATSASGTVSRSDYTARANLPILVAGASNAANYSGSARVTIPNYLGTTFYKAIDETDGQQDSTSGNQITLQRFEYLSTSAITRLKITPLTAAKNLKVGTQLLIYKRRS